ncbi:RHS repeat domain-containing protein [Pseudomonas viridiflava]|uniref:RHS repeat domain-containing protein n=1 Tax=Pseudomonas viridiflava TaxID=33069 RepID=UPI001F12247D|nr:RHS repeat-associated core domain-containing protein [Pseudomonas viridiflava]WKW33830.1 RHS repeat protein [Pseudomonas viridiflava]
MNTANTSLHCYTPTLQVTDPRGLPVRSAAFFRLNAADEPEIRVDRSAFDAAGRLVGRWDARLWAVQAAANVISRHSLSGSVLSTDSVDAGWRVVLPGESGQPIYVWDGRKTVRSMQYDALLRPTAVFEDQRCVERLLYGGPDLAARNLCGQLSRHDDPAGTRLNGEFGLTGTVIAQTRHFLRELDSPDWSESIPERNASLEVDNGATTHWRYNPLGEVIQRTDALGSVHFLDQTVAGQLKASRLQLGNQSEKTLVSDIRYDAQNRVVSETAGNGVVSTAVYQSEDGRLVELKATNAYGSLLQNLLYAYDAVGNVLRIEDCAQPTEYYANQRIDPVSTYRYDTLYQLVEATGREAATVKHGPTFPFFQSPPDPAQLANYTQTYRYDASGNLLQLTHVGAQSHSQTMAVARRSNRSLPVIDNLPPGEEEIARAFDANGNLLALQAGQNLSWDRRNQLQDVRPVIREAGEDDSEHYRYDASGQRVRKVRVTQAGSVVHRAEVRYLPGLEIRTNTATREMLYVITGQAGRSGLRVLHWEAGQPDSLDNDQIRYTLNDHLGSGTLELDEQAHLISQESYYPFGGTSWWAARSAIEASYKTVRYSGKERDVTGLYYYGLRYYASWLQRWINPDPAGNVDGLNLYRMVKNNPMCQQDRCGTQPNDINDPELLEADPQPLPTVLPLLPSTARDARSSALEATGSTSRFTLRPAGYKKYVTLDYPDFTIKQFESHSPVAKKDLIIHGHGRLRSPVHKIYNAPIKLGFYAPPDNLLSVSRSELYRFQSRKLQVAPVEVIECGMESRDYEIAYSSAFDSKFANGLYHSQLLNRKPAISASSIQHVENYHDVLIVKPGKSVPLSKLLKQVPAYDQVHALFCRSRGLSGPVHEFSTTKNRNN